MRETRTVEKIFQYWHRQRSTFSCAFWFFSCVRTEQTPLEKERKKEATREREREREREKKREKERRERESPSTKNTTTKAPLFAERKNTEKRLSSLSTHHGEPRSGGNLERVTREKRERGAFLIVCGCVFSLFFLSKRSARKVRERFYSFPK